MKRLVIVLSAYNNEEIIEKCIKSCLNQDHDNTHVVVADDGSTDRTGELLMQMREVNPRLHVLLLPHGERGRARKAAMEEADTLAPDYIYIIDSDMILKKDLASACIDYLEKNIDLGALVIPELAFSEHRNFYSRVKVFERNVVNRAGRRIGATSIEAARFWKRREYERSGGIDEKQISFEETQPTIRYMGGGGQIERAVFTGVDHDEKYVTLKNILDKKRYYFSVMDRTLTSEEDGFSKALKRWYFFRGVLYRRENLVEYIKHPILTLGMIHMYMALTFVWLQESLKR